MIIKVETGQSFDPYPLIQSFGSQTWTVVRALDKEETTFVSKTWLSTGKDTKSIAKAYSRMGIIWWWCTKCISYKKVSKHMLKYFRFVISWKSNIVITLCIYAVYSKNQIRKEINLLHFLSSESSSRRLSLEKYSPETMRGTEISWWRTLIQTMTKGLE